MTSITAADVAGLLSRLRTAGVQLRAENGRLVLDAPRGAVDDDLLALVRASKEELLRRLTTGGGTGPAAARLPAAAPARWYPLSSGQQRLYYTQLLYPDAVTYQILDVLRLDGPVEAARVENTLRALVRRHEGLRTGFDLVDDEPRFTVHDEVDFHLERVTDPGFTPGDTADFVRPFDLTAPPLLRGRLVEVRDDLHYLLLDKHHLVFDAASREPFARDFARIHRGETPPPPARTYKDFAVWQNDLEGTELTAAAAHWDTVFSAAPRVGPDPVKAHPELFGTDSRRAHVDLTGEEIRRVGAYCRAQGLTTATFLQAAYHVALHRFSGQDEVVVGFPVDLRAGVGLDDQLGLFVNTVPVRSFPEDRLLFTEYAATVRDGVLAAIDHGQYPYDALVDRVSARRNMSEDPLVDGFFNMATEGTGPSPWAAAGLTEEAGDPKAALPELPCLTCRFDLTLSVLEGPGTLRLELECTTALLDEATVGRIVRDMAAVVHHVVADPGTTIGALPGAEAVT
ncbi:condensation domain-containing protein [Streptomyces sp. NPDC050732]|uniref:condensation domain-containing protein n=1 Tax=Streptomyces sp. NPDC050732 TaxID=3154632 RepID=UPI00343D1470